MNAIDPTTTATGQPGEAAPPPPPSPAAEGRAPTPPWGAAPPRTPRPPRRPWRDRLPEVVATIGAVLVVLALAGFASSTWTLLNEYAKALALGAVAAGLTVAGLWADQSGRRTFAALVPTVWATATAVLVGAVLLALQAAMPDAGRVAIAVAGTSGAIHGALLWQRRPDALLTQLATASAAVFAAGPVGTALADRWTAISLAELTRPLAGLLDPTVESDAFLLVAVAHLVIGVAWLAVARAMTGGPAHLARVGGSTLVAYAAMEFNVLELPLGAAIALLIVLGYLIAGIVLDDVFLVIVGTVGALATGVKVIWALFTGEVAVTLTIFVVGLAMLAWAQHAARGREDATT